MKASIAEKNYKDLRKDIKSILSILKDNEEFGAKGGKGLVSRVYENESQIIQAAIERRENRQELKNLKTKIVIYSGLTAAVAATSIQALVGYLF
jgi:aspartyl aminopeptidase